MKSLLYLYLQNVHFSPFLCHSCPFLFHSGGFLLIPVDSGAIPADSCGFQWNGFIPAGISGAWWSTAFLGTYEVHQFLDLGHLEGTPFHSGIWIPYHTIPYHLTSYHTIRGVWGPFTIYEKYFYRLQYLSVGLHLLWTGSLDFCCHFKLQVEAIEWAWSFEDQLNWALSQVLAIYTLDNPSQAT